MTTAPPMDREVTDAMLEHAMMWRQRMEAPDWSVDDDAELEAWLQADDRHERAFARTGEVWTVFDQHVAAPELIAARRALLGRVQRQVKGRWNAPGRPTRRLAAAAMIAAAVLGAGIWPLATQGDVYQTGRGERRVVILHDGSVLSLDALTKVSVRYSKDARRLTLQRGQARFDVAHDTTRPFSVTARNRTVVATGTAFNIDILKPEVRVTLIEGRVLILPHETAPIPLVTRPAKPPKSVELHAGEALVAARDGAPQLVAKADLEQATSWQKGKLMFDREPLRDAVEQMNRYSERRIVVADARAAAIPISGVFNAGDVNAFLEAINGFVPVTVTENSDEVVLRSPDPAG